MVVIIVVAYVIQDSKIKGGNIFLAFSIFEYKIIFMIYLSKKFADELQYYDIKPANEQQTSVKCCPCKKYFVEHLGLTKEQVKFFDTNRENQQKELKPVNNNIRENYKQIKEIKASDLSDEQKTEKISKLKEENSKLKEKSANIKIKYNEKFEKSLTDEQVKTLEHMRELKKQGKSCCPCGKNRYY